MKTMLNTLTILSALALSSAVLAVDSQPAEPAAGDEAAEQAQVRTRTQARDGTGAGEASKAHRFVDRDGDGVNDGARMQSRGKQAKQQAGAMKRGQHRKGLRGGQGEGHGPGQGAGGGSGFGYGFVDADGDGVCDNYQSGTGSSTSPRRGPGR